MKIYFTILFIWIVFLQNISNLCQITAMGPTTINCTINVTNVSISGNTSLEGNINKNTSLDDNNSLVIGNTQSINPTQIIINNLPGINNDMEYAYIMLDINNNLYISSVFKSIFKESDILKLNSLYTNIITSNQNNSITINSITTTNTVIGKNQNSIINLIGNQIILNGIIKSKNNLLSFTNTISTNNIKNINIFIIDSISSNQITSNNIIFNKETNFNNNMTNIYYSGDKETNFYNKFIMDGKLININADELLFNKIYIKGLPVLMNQSKNIDFLCLDSNTLKLNTTNNFNYNSVISLDNIENLDNTLNITVNKFFELTAPGFITTTFNSKNTYINDLEIEIASGGFFLTLDENNPVITLQKDVYINNLDVSNAKEISITNLSLINNTTNIINSPFSLTAKSFNINPYQSTGTRLVLDANFNLGLEPGSSENFKENITDLAISKEQFIENIQPKYLEIKDKENKKKEIFLTICPQKLQDPILKLICDYDENGNVIGYEERGLLTILLTQILNIYKELSIFNLTAEEILEKEKKFQESEEKFELYLQLENEKSINLLIFEKIDKF